MNEQRSVPVYSRCFIVVTAMLITVCAIGYMLSGDFQTSVPCIFYFLLVMSDSESSSDNFVEEDVPEGCFPYLFGPEYNSDSEVPNVVESVVPQTLVTESRLESTANW